MRTREYEDLKIMRNVSLLFKLLVHKRGCEHPLPINIQTTQLQ